MTHQGIFLYAQQSRVLKLMSQLVVFLMLFLSVEPIMATWQETESEDRAAQYTEYARARLAQIRFDVEQTYANLPSRGLLAEILQRQRDKNVMRPRVSPFASHQAVRPHGPALPATTFAPATLARPWLPSQATSTVLSPQTQAAPDPLTHLPTFVRDNLTVATSPVHPASAEKTAIRESQTSLSDHLRPLVSETQPSSLHTQDADRLDFEQVTLDHAQTLLDETPPSQIETQDATRLDFEQAMDASDARNHVLLAENDSDLPTQYTLLAQSYCKNKYAVGAGSSRQSLFVDAYNRKGGGKIMGCTINAAHWWGSVVIQDFRYSPYVADAAIIHDEPRDNPAFSVPAVALYGGIWNMYRKLGGPSSWLGIPTGEENHYDPAVSSRVRAYFKNGYIQWDTAVTPYSARGKAYRWPDPDPNLWREEYHNGFNLNAGATFLRNVANIDYNWGTEFPGGNCHNDPCWGVWKDNYSVRWTKRVSFQAGRYNFIARADDGVRVWIDGNLILDGWYDHGTLEFRRTVDVSGGNHDLKVEYYERSGSANIKFWWEPVTSPDGSLAHWKLDRNTLDASGSNYHGTQTGGIVYANAEIDDGAIFDGKDDYISVNNSANGLSFGGAAAFTIDGWINPRRGGAGGTILSKFNYHVRGEYYLMINPNGTVQFHREAAPWNLVTTQTIPYGEFTHVAVTYDGATMRIYINGKPAIEQARGAQATDTVTPVLIGAQYVNNAPTLFFDGIMDDVRLYNRALSREEILYYATETKPGPLSAKDRDRFRKLGVQPCFPGTGDPVTAPTGNPIQQFADLVVPGLGDLDLTITRTFNGLDDREGSFGKGWSTFLDVNLRIANDGSIDVREPDGRSVYFVRSGTQYTPGQGGVFDTLTRIDTGFQLTKPDQQVYLFDYKGRLTTLRDRYGYTLTLYRDAGGRLTRITDTVGRELRVASDGVHITAITDPIGRIISYAYDTNGNLVSVTDANGGVRLFAYTNRRLTKVTDPEGIVYLNNIYDAAGRVIEQIDADGKHAYFDYSTPNQTVYTDALGQKTTYRYDALGRVTDIRDALGQTETNVYDANYNLIAHTDKRGNTWTYTYDTRGNMLSETDPSGALTRFTYNATNDMLTMIAPNGGVTTYTWQAGNLVKLASPDGSTIASTYNASGQIVSLTDALGYVTKYTYDLQGNLAVVTDPLGKTTTYEYDAVGRQVKMTDANGHVVQFAYDGKDNVTKITYPDGTSVAFAYSKNDDVVKITDRLGGVTTYQYDANLKLIAETDPAGYTTRYEYDAQGRMLKETDPRGNVTRYAYDAVGQLLTVTDALGAVTQFAYDPNGNVTIATDALGRQTRYAYDPLNRLAKQTDALGGVTTFAYDAMGQLATLTEASGATTQHTYDVMGRLTKVNDALGQTVKMAYDARGDLIGVTDANGATNTLKYDALGNLIESVNALGQTSNFTYDAVGNRLTETDALGRTTTFAYDVNDNLVSATDPLGFVTKFVYDGDDRLLALTDANGATTRFEYDKRGLLVKQTDANNHATAYEYDAAQNLIKQTNAKDAVWTFAYDPLNRLIKLTDPLQQTTIRTYDQLGRLVQVTDALGQLTKYEYDALDRKIKTIDPTGGIWQFAYDSADNLIRQTDPRGATTQFTYDLTDQLVEIRNALDGVEKFAYDPAGNLTSMTDANGHTVTMQYDAEDRLSATSDALGNVTQYAYDAAGNVTTVTDALARVTKYVYDDGDQLIQIVDALNRKTVMEYDREGNLTALTDPLAQTTRFTYDPNGLLLAETNPLGQTTSYEYDALDNLVKYINAKGNAWTFGYDAIDRLASETDPLGKTTAYKYDSRDRLIELTNKLGQTTSYAYDALDCLTKQTDAAGQVWQFACDAVGNVIAQTDPRGATTQFTYDLLDQLTGITNALGSTSQLSYDLGGNLTGMTDANKHAVTFEYDAAHRLLKQIDPLGKATSYEYDPVGNVRAQINALEQRTQYAYDAVDHLISLTDALGNKTRLEYDQNDNVIALTDANGHTTRFGYDANGLLTSETLPGDETTTYQYDATQNLIKRINPKGAVWTYTYDALNRVLSETDPLNHATSYAYDALDNLTRLTDANGNQTDYGYDVLQRLTQVRQANKAITRYAYDAADNLIAITNALGHTTQFDYDVAHRLIQENDPLGQTWQYAYDAADNLLQRNANGMRTQYAYDAKNQVTAINHPDGTNVQFQYDALGNETSMTDQFGVTSKEYDQLNRLQATTNHAGQRVGYAYDPVGNLTKLTYPDNRALSYEYDANDNLRRIIDPQALVFDVTRDAAQNVTKVSNPNGTAVEYAWDDAERLTGVRNTQGGDVISAFAYTLDPVGNVVKSDEDYQWRNPRQLSHTYTYDALYQLIKTQDSAGNVTEYAFDAVGNRVRQTTNLADAPARLTTTYRYGADNRLTGVQNFTADAGGAWQLRDETELAYDGYGRTARRIHKQNGQQTQIDYVFDGLDPIAEYANGDAQHLNIYRGPDGILGLGEYDAQGQGQAYYYHPDRLGSLSALTDAQGQVAHGYRYGDYGAILDRNDKPADSSSFRHPANRYAYTGQETDAPNNLIHFFARDYDPQTGGWLEQDVYRGEVNSPSSLHRYAYVENNPITMIDVLGYFKQATNTVEAGDSLWKIANSTGITVDTLITLNPQIANPNYIYPGQHINLPSPVVQKSVSVKSHEVQTNIINSVGDTNRCTLISQLPQSHQTSPIASPWKEVQPSKWPLEEQGNGKTTKTAGEKQNPYSISQCKVFEKGSVERKRCVNKIIAQTQMNAMREIVKNYEEIDRDLEFAIKLEKNVAITGITIVATMGTVGLGVGARQVGKNVSKILVTPVLDAASDYFDWKGNKKIAKIASAASTVGKILNLKDTAKDIKKGWQAWKTVGKTKIRSWDSALKVAKTSTKALRAKVWGTRLIKTPVTIYNAISDVKNIYNEIKSLTKANIKQKVLKHLPTAITTGIRVGQTIFKVDNYIQKKTEQFKRLAGETKDQAIEKGKKARKKVKNFFKSLF